MNTIIVLRCGGNRPVRFIGSGEPTSPQNGDIWVDESYSLRTTLLHILFYIRPFHLQN